MADVWQTTIFFKVKPFSTVTGDCRHVVQITPVRLINVTTNLKTEYHIMFIVTSSTFVVSWPPTQARPFSLVAL